MSGAAGPADPVAQAAQQLLRAARDGVPTSPVRGLIGRDDVRAAYAVQRAVNAPRLEAGARVVGRKIGLTSPVVQAQLGVDRPDFGVLFDDMDRSAARGAARISLGELLQPRVEAEIAFVLGTDLTEDRPDEATIRAAVVDVRPALEIVDSRIAGWDISFADTVADNGSSALFVLGRASRSLADFEPVRARMSMRRGDAEVSTGSGEACLGDPLNALAWLARTAAEVGDPLLAGEVVLSGALGPMVTVDGAGTFTAEITGLGTVSVTFEERESA